MDDTTRSRLDAVYAAAERLLEAREASMLTADEWDALEHACQARREPDTPNIRTEAFRVEPGGCLVRSVVPQRGEPYEHRCTLATFEAVAVAVGVAGPDPVTLEDIRERCGLPWTQVAVAVAFLKERGIIAPAGNRAHAAVGGDAYLDAMTEYHALRERPG